MSDRPPRVVVLETKVAAHSGYYLLYLAQHWRPREVGEELVFLLPPTFAERHPGPFAALTSEDSRGRSIRVEEIAPHDWSETRRVPPMLRPLLRLRGARRHLALRLEHLAQWLLLRRRLATLRPRRVLIMSLDDMLLPAVLAPPPAGVSCTGIWFGPSFHYGQIGHDERTAGVRLRAGLDVWLVTRFARRRHNSVLCLDPLAVRALRSRLGERITVLPEPARAHRPDPEQLRQLAARLGLEPQRRSFLLLGSLGPRRGLDVVLAALDHLGGDEARTGSLLLVGTLPSKDRCATLAAIELLRSTSAFQVVLAEEAIPEAELMLYFHLADVVLVTHRRHVGSSGNLLHAAAAGRPVIATRAGLIGHLVRSENLGLVVDTSSPLDIGQALSRALSSPLEALFDPASARRFAERNTPRRYAEALLAALASPSAAGERRQ